MNTPQHDMRNYAYGDAGVQSEGDLKTPKDLRLLEAYGGNKGTAVAAREIVSRRRNENRLGGGSRYEKIPAAELIALVDEIEMLDALLTELKQAESSNDPAGLRVVSKSLRESFDSNPQLIIGNLERKLATMKALAVHKAAQQELAEAEPRAERRSESPTFVDFSVGTRYSAEKRKASSVAPSPSSIQRRLGSRMLAKPAVPFPPSPKSGTFASNAEDKSLKVREKNIRAYFDPKLVPSRDANSWLARNRHSDELNWITGLRHYESYDHQV